jgi:hypothetical protein
MNELAQQIAVFCGISLVRLYSLHHAYSACFTVVYVV